MKLDNKFTKNIPENIENSDENVKIIFRDLYDKLNNKKNKINNKSDEWDKIKRITNPYELIFISYNQNNNISDYLPISRSYFKMIEMLQDYNLINTNKNIIVACLAEGPGGFMEAIINKRKLNNDKIYGLTLPPTDSKIPNWDKIKTKILDKIILNYGNLYNLNDIMKFSKNFENNKASLITADGGFDYSIDFNNQEQLSLRIIYCEIVTALLIQKNGGNFICKIFDIFTNFTLNLIYILYCLYDEVYIIKPCTSRPANSEKYIICKGFNGINENLLSNMLEIINKWSEENIKNLDGIDIPEEFRNYIYKYNREFVENETHYIDLTLNFINEKPDKKTYYNMTKKQAINAKKWCINYGIPVNYGNKYLQ